MPHSIARILTRIPHVSRTRAIAHVPPRPTRPSQLPDIAIRSVASTVSSRPASQTLPHAITNAKEEAGNSAKDLAKTIAGNVMPSEAVLSTSDNFIGITSAIASNVPRPILTMGLAGSLPYLVTSLSTIYFARQAGLAASGAEANVDVNAALALLESCTHIQITYGAVLISFAGALHWGMEFAGYNGHKGYPRLFFGAVPVVFAWSTLALEPAMALVAQWVGYTGLWYADMKVTTAGWTPKWYSQYRFYLSILVGTCIIGTLAGTSYLGPSPGHDEAHRMLEEIRARHELSHIGFVSGPIEAVPTGDDGDAYVKISKKKERKEDDHDK